MRYWIIGLAVLAAFLILVNYLLERARENREVAHEVKISPYTGGAYADMGEVIQSELERIRAKEVCTDKSHWKRGGDSPDKE